MLSEMPASVHAITSTEITARYENGGWFGSYQNS